MCSEGDFRHALPWLCTRGRRESQIPQREGVRVPGPGAHLFQHLWASGVVPGSRRSAHKRAYRLSKENTYLQRNTKVRLTSQAT